MCVAICVVAVLASACHSGPSRADTIRQWDAICRATQARLETIKVPNVTTKSDLPRFLKGIRKALPIALGEIDQLRAVPVPKEDHDVADGILSELVGAAGQLQAAERSAKKGDLKATERSLRRSASATKAAGEAARSFGLQVCGQAA
jgi:hypothetical protein